MNYRVSVITSIFKAGQFIEHFLQDIKRQSIFHECEFLLLDADSPDKEIDVISPFLDFENIKYFNIGKCSVYDAWNKGIKLSNSNFLTNWNTDDRRVYHSLETQVKLLESSSDIDVCYGYTIETDKPNLNFESCDKNRLINCYEGKMEDMLETNSPHCLPMWRKDIHERFGNFDTNYFSGADYDMWLRVLAGGGKLQKINEIVGAYYHNPNGISTKSETLKKAIEEVMSIRKKYL
jgi:hypothetical protein